jgi:hypothetical protein
MKLAQERAAMPDFEAFRRGKPSKRNRRELAQFRNKTYTS